MFSGVYLNRDTSKLMIAERLEDGSRRIMETPLVLEYYVPDSRGKYVGIDGVVLRKIAVKNLRQFYQVKKDEAAKKKEDPNYRTYGLDANITHQTMYKFYKQNYGECPTPELHKSFFDIEVDLGNEKGVSIAELIEKGHKPINAISIYNDWEQKLYTAALYPPTLEKEEADAIIADYPDALMFDDEKKLIKQFIQWFSDADIEVGWNSGRFDIPYIIQRIKTLFADEGEYAVNEVLESLSPFLALPQGKEKTTEFGDKYTEYDIPGVWLADMMVIYKKHITHEHESYKLDNIADEELSERKVAYEGTLDDLFRDDFKTFIDYNRQDTMLVYKLDKKTNYLNLHNMQAHELMIPLDVTMGTVGWFSQAVINYAKDHDQIVPDRWEARQAQWEGIKAPGAFVQNPVPGLHQWVSDMDMTSLYPSVIRCLNMSPETIVGQMRLEYTLPYLRDKIIKNGLWEKMAKRIPNWAKAWSGDEMFGTLEYQLIMKKSDTVITCDYEDGKVYKMTGAQWYDFIFNQGNQICISAFGTLYRTDIEGIVPALLTKWFGERKAYKKKMKAYEDMLDGVELPPDFDRGALEGELQKLGGGDG